MVDFTGDEAAILADIRKLITVLPANNEEDMSYEECTDDLNRVCSDLANCAADAALALSRISDGSFFMEVKSAFAPSMVTGFIRLNGNTVG